MFDLDPLAFADFDRVEDEGAFGAAGVDPDEFVAGLLAGRLLEDALQILCFVEADLLAEFAPGRAVVVLAAVNMAGAGADPLAGGGVFCHGTALQVELADLVENEDVDGPVVELLAVHKRARLLAKHLVLGVNDIE